MQHRLFMALFPLVCFAGDFDETIRPFLKRNCETCHNAKLNSGNLNLTSYASADSVVRNRETWELMLKRLRAGEMPPKGLPGSDPAESRAVVNWIAGELARSERPIKPRPGHVTARRLNRAEYNSTIHDLLAVDLSPADDFPQDDAGYGFDNIGDVLSLSPVLMEKYLAAAEHVAREALFGPVPRKPSVVRLQPVPQHNAPHLTPPSDYDLTGLTHPSALHAVYRVPVEAEYVLRTSVEGSRPAGSSPIRVSFWIDGQELKSLEIDPDVNGPSSAALPVQDFSGREGEFRAHLTAGDHWLAVAFPRIFEGLPESFNGPNPSHRPLPPPLEFQEYVRKFKASTKPEAMEALRKDFELVKNMPKVLDGFKIGSLDVVGPYDVSTKPSIESLRRIYTCGHLDGHHQPGCARIILSNLLLGTFRRPVTVEEVDRYTGLLPAARREGASFAEGIELALEAMLVSPHFLFRIENSGARAAGSDHPISPYELASRLSYFLWSSLPDDELRRASDNGTLRQPEVLAAQVRRMLKDPKSSRLVENFGGQWLEFRALESVERDRLLFPGFDNYLRLSMKQETMMFLENIVRRDRGILEILDARYTFLNERLAKFYGIAGVEGPKFRRVDLSDYPQRGGILTHASVLTVSSYATRISPVLRGKWILENILNDPPPPPPPDIPNLDVTNVGISLSLRQQLEAHRANAICASCHRKMDPLGFGLANYDAIGGWQSMDGKFPIDASGTLPDGRTFSGAEGLRHILDQDRDAFARAVTAKLLIYALGRGLDPFDRSAVDAIVRNAADHEYRFSSVVLGIVNSVPFQMQAETKPGPERASNDHHP